MKYLAALLLLLTACQPALIQSNGRMAVMGVDAQGRIGYLRRVAPAVSLMGTKVRHSAQPFRCADYLWCNNGR